MSDGPRNQRAPAATAAKRPRHSKSLIDPVIVIFSSDSRYHPVTWILLSIAPLMLLVSIFKVHTDYSLDYSYQQHATWTLVWTFILVVLIFMSVLPKEVDVRSNGSVGVKTFLFTFRFKHVARAFQAETFSNCGNLLTTIKFETTVKESSRVVVRRKYGKWDISVTPEDPEGFINAVEEVVNKLEQNAGHAQDSQEHNRSKNGSLV